MEVHDRFWSAVLVGGAIFAVVTVGLYGVRVWAYRHPDNPWAQGALMIYG